MPEFNYVGVARNGKKVTGKMDLPNEGELRMVLRGQGIRPTRITKAGAFDADIGLFLKGGVQSVPLEMLVAFTRQLQVLTGAGIPIVQGLEILVDQTTHFTFKNVIIAVKEKVSQGSYLWEAIGAYPKIFPKLYIALIRAGEASGSMDNMLKRLSKYLEDADRIRKLIKAALMYPMIVVIIGIGVVAAMMIFVIPKFEEMLVGSGQSLPGPTQFVIDLSHFLVKNVHYIIGTLAVTYYVVSKYFKTDEGRAVGDRIIFRLPVFGAIVQKGGVARFARTMQTLLSSGVNLIDAIEICKATIDNAVLEEAVSKIRSEVEGGKTLGMVITGLSVFPRMAVQMISVGESTGNLDKMLEKVADFFESEVEALVGGMTRMIEPLVIVFLGSTVGGILIAMYLPIFKMAGSV